MTINLPMFAILLAVTAIILTLFILSLKKYNGDCNGITFSLFLLTAFSFFMSIASTAFFIDDKLYTNACNQMPHEWKIIGLYLLNNPNTEKEERYYNAFLEKYQDTNSISPLTNEQRDTLCSETKSKLICESLKNFVPTEPLEALPELPVPEKLQKDGTLKLEGP